VEDERRRVFGIVLFGLFYIFLLLIFHSQKKFTPFHSFQYPFINSGTAVNVKSYGALGNGIQDDTDAIQSAVDYVSRLGGGIVIIPDGTYMIDSKRSISLPSKLELKLMPGAILKALPNNLGHYRVVCIDGQNGVVITGGTIEGERNRHMGKDGEWGMGIEIDGSRNVIVNDININNCWGDGIYLGTGRAGFNENIKIQNVKETANRRNGISIISGDNVDVENCIISQSGGTEPGDGVDIEPNDLSDVISGIRLFNILTSTNAGNGLEISLSKVSGRNKNISVQVIKYMDRGSQNGLRLSSEALSGTIMIEQSSWLDNKNKPFVKMDNTSFVESLFWEPRLKVNFVK
jgi:hypothetical protein